MKNNNGYQMFKDEDLKRKTNNPNQCWAIRIDNKEGADHCYYDLMNEGFDKIPDFSNREENNFPVVIIYDDEEGEWNEVC